MYFVKFPPVNDQKQIKPPEYQCCFRLLCITDINLKFIKAMIDPLKLDKEIKFNLLILEVGVTLIWMQFLTDSNVIFSPESFVWRFGACLKL